MTCKLRELVTTPVGKLTIDPAPYFQESVRSADLYLAIRSVWHVIRLFR